MNYVHLNEYDIRNAVGVTVRSYRYDSGKTVMHCHNFLEFEYIVSGCGYHYVNDRKVEISPGDFWGIGTEDFHRYEVRDVEMRNLIVLPSRTTEDIRKLLEGQRFPMSGNVPPPKRKRVEELFGMVNESYGNPSPYSNPRLAGLTLALLTEYLEYAAEQPSIKKAGAYRYIQSALQYITQNSHRSLTIQETADAVNLSVSYLSTIFYEYVGCHFPEYLSRIRLKNACLLLSETNFSVTEIAARTGFVCTSTMNRAFLRYQGVSPSEYRKQNRIKTSSEVSL